MIELQGLSCCRLDPGSSWSEILRWSSLILLLTDVHFCWKKCTQWVQPPSLSCLAQKARGSFCLDVLRVLFLWVQRVQFFIECSPWASCFLVQKARGSKKLKMYFFVVGPCSPRAFSGFFSFEKKSNEGSWCVVVCCSLEFLYSWSFVFKSEPPGVVEANAEPSSLVFD